MHAHQRLKSRRKPNASQIARIAWLAFATLAVSLAVRGIPHYLELLRTPCNGAHCFGAQLTREVTRAWSAAEVNLTLYTFSQLCVLLLLDGLLLSTAMFLIWRHAHQGASILAAFVGVALATSTLSHALAYSDPRFWLPAQGILFVQMAGLLPLVCLLPDGRFQPRWLRWVALTYVLATGLYLLPSQGAWFAPGTLGRRVWLSFAVAALLVALAVVVYRFRTATTSARQEQLQWLLAGLGLAALAVLLGTPLGLMPTSLLSMELTLPGRYAVSMLMGMLLAVGSFTCLLVALVNDQPLDTGVLVNRTLVYAALTAFVIGAYGAIVGYLSTVFQSENVLFSLIATGVVAILFQPLRDRLQRVVNRLVYGARDEPYRLVTQLGQRLEAAIEPASALPLTVETVAHALKLPYVAITLKPDPAQPIAAYGAPQKDCAHFPLVYAGATIGELVAARRAPHEPLTLADYQLLQDLARQIGVTAHATLLAAELERARLRIVAAHEETRRRLGSDLHDGVGHQLAALARQAELATHLLAQDPMAVRGLLTDITRELNAAIKEVRGLAHQLHPPELELLGLVGALRERVQTHTTLVMRMEAPDALPPLPTAIETAAYYIALEALTNIEKHAGARTCHLRLALVNGATALHPPLLQLDITDDGCGLLAGAAHGLGLLSMQARAAEAGGICRIASDPDGGTRVSVRLPCPTAMH